MTFAGGGVGRLFPPGLVERGMARETARATASLVARQITVPQALGATVTAVSRLTGQVSVHLDGDTPGESVQVSSADWELYDVGQRVFIELWPPSFAALVGPMGPPAPWTPYGIDPQPVLWTTDTHKTPTVSVTTTGVDLISNATSLNFSGGSPTAGQYVVVLLGMVAGPSQAVPAFSGISNSGSVPLSWTQLATRTSAGGNNGYARSVIYGAYVPANTGATTITVTFASGGNQCQGTATVLRCTNALPIQNAAVLNQSATLNPNVTTAVDHSLLVGVTAGWGTNVSGSGYYFNFGTTGVTNRGDLSPSNQYRDVMTWTDTTTTAGAQGAQGTTSTPGTVPDNGSASEIATCVVEILGVPDVPVLGDGFAVGYYRLRGKSMDLRIGIVGGANMTFGSGQYRLMLPPGFTASPLPPGGIQQIAGSMRPAGANSYRIIAEIAAGADRFDKVLYADGGTTYWGATTPVTATTSIKFGLNGTIEVA